MMVHACFTCSTAHGILNLYFLALLCLKGVLMQRLCHTFSGGCARGGKPGFPDLHFRRRDAPGAETCEPWADIWESTGRFWD